MNRRICFIAPSGYGKSTAIKIISQKYKVENVKIAKPLYDMQEYFYDKIETPIKGEQDGELLQFLGAKIRKENSQYLLSHFRDSVESIEEGDVIVTNDDCRPPDYECLKDMGFVFVGIKGYRHDRCDHSSVDAKNKLEWQSEIKCDYYIDNSSSIENYEKQLDSLMGDLMEEIEC